MRNFANEILSEDYFLTGFKIKHLLMRGDHEMKYKRIIFISLLLSLISLMCLNAISQELPFLMDLAQLKLEVTNTEVVDQISSSNFGRDATTTADEGYKLVVVTLKGIVPHPCRIAIETRDFSAVYEKETSNSKGEKEVSLGFDVSDAIATTDDSWILTGDISYFISILYIREPGPTIIKVAFIFPEKITSFFVRYPTLAKGKATISAQAGE